jgi:hypothetical protein
MDAFEWSFLDRLTGLAFVLAGLAIISGVLDVLAAKLLGLMLVHFQRSVRMASLPTTTRDVSRTLIPCWATCINRLSYHK